MQKLKTVKQNFLTILYKLLLRNLMNFSINEFNKFNISLLGNQKKYLNPLLSHYLIFFHPE